MNTKASIGSTATAYAHRISVGRHELVADEPPALGGQDAGLAPFDLYLASLAACTAITLRMSAQKKGWDLGELRAELALTHDADDKPHVHRTLWASGTLDDAQWQRLLEVAARTPVTNAMRDGAVITTARGA